MAVVKITIGPVDTPCGPLSVTVSTPVPLPSIPLPIPIPFPWKFKIPMPDCSSLKRLATSAPEPAEDSVP